MYWISNKNKVWSLMKEFHFVPFTTYLFQTRYLFTPRMYQVCSPDVIPSFTIFSFRLRVDWRLRPFPIWDSFNNYYRTQGFGLKLAGNQQAGKRGLSQFLLLKRSDLDWGLSVTGSEGFDLELDPLLGLRWKQALFTYFIGILTGTGVFLTSRTGCKLGSLLFLERLPSSWVPY